MLSQFARYHYIPRRLYTSTIIMAETAGQSNQIAGGGETELGVVQPEAIVEEESNSRVYEAQNIVDLLEATISIIGKDGPCYLDHGIIMHNIFLTDEQKQELSNANITDKFPIGEAGRQVTLQDILDTFRQVSIHPKLVEVRSDGRGYFQEGFGLSEDGKTIEMYWGS